MTNLKLTHQTVENSFGTFKYTGWEIYGYELLRITDVNHPEDPAEWRVRTPKKAPTLDNMNLSAREGVDYGVNWSAKGTRSAREARAYAIQLIHASDAAEAFTKIRNDYSD